MKKYIAKKLTIPNCKKLVGTSTGSDNNFIGKKYTKATQMEKRRVMFQ